MYFLTLIAAFQAFMVSLDLVLAPDQKAKVTNFFEDHWYRNLEGLKVPRYRRIAGDLSSRYSTFTSRRSVKRYLIGASVLAALFFLISQLLHLYFFYDSAVEVFGENMSTYFLSLWIWTFPPSLIISVLLLYISLKITARILRDISTGDWLDSLMLPILDLTVSVLLLMALILFVQLIPLIYLGESVLLAIYEAVSATESYYQFLHFVMAVNQTFAMGMFGSAYVVFLPTLLLYLVYFGFLIISILELLLQKVFSHAGLLSSYNNLGEKPFTLLGGFISCFLLLIKLLQTVIT